MAAATRDGRQRQTPGSSTGRTGPPNASQPSSSASSNVPPRHRNGTSPSRGSSRRRGYTRGHNNNSAHTNGTSRQRRSERRLDERISRMADLIGVDLQVLKTSLEAQSKSESKKITRILYEMEQDRGIMNTQENSTDGDFEESAFASGSVSGGLVDEPVPLLGVQPQQPLLSGSPPAAQNVPSPETPMKTPLSPDMSFMFDSSEFPFFDQMPLPQSPPRGIPVPSSSSAEPSPSSYPHSSRNQGHSRTISMPQNSFPWGTQTLQPSRPFVPAAPSSLPSSSSFLRPGYTESAVVGHHRRAQSATTTPQRSIQNFVPTTPSPRRLLRPQSVSPRDLGTTDDRLNDGLFGTFQSSDVQSFDRHRLPIPSHHTGARWDILMNKNLEKSNSLGLTQSITPDFSKLSINQLSYTPPLATMSRQRSLATPSLAPSPLFNDSTPSTTALTTPITPIGWERRHLRGASSLSMPDWTPSPPSVRSSPLPKTPMSTAFPQRVLILMPEDDHSFEQ